VHIYIGFETLKVKCTQYGICSQLAFKNARAMFFSKLGGAGSNFRSGSKKSRAGPKISREGCPRLNLTPPIVRWGVVSVTRSTLCGPNGDWKRLAYVMSIGQQEYPLRKFMVMWFFEKHYDKKNLLFLISISLHGDFYAMIVPKSQIC
jgi:hypothetical protein